jgi:hypothetical protein
MLSPKLANMPLVMRKFVKASNMFPSNLPMKIYKNASLGQRNLMKVNMNGTKLALKLV